MNIASIDIGSNTIILLIAKIVNNNIIPIFNEYRAPRISEGLNISRNISEIKIFELLKILKDFQKIIDNYGCERTIAFATNAFRIAKNSNQIINEIKTKIGLEIITITGEKEAGLSYFGAISDFPFQNNLVIDIGGGSTEIIFGNKSNFSYLKSFPIGVVNLTERFVTSLPATDSEIADVEIQIDNHFDSLPELSDQYHIIAVAGTPTTLSCIKQGLKTYDEALVNCSTLSFDDLLRIKEKLKKLDRNQIIKNYGSVVIGREDVLLTGLLILQKLLERYKIRTINVSGKGIRYGAIIDYLNKK